jgi:hypothetical protein
MTDHNNDFVSRLTQAARDNPLAAALIGGGALWLMLGDRVIGGAAGGMAAGARSAAEAGQQGLSQAADSMSAAGARSLDRATDGARAAADAAGSAVDSVRQGVSGMVERAGAAFSQAAEATRASVPDPAPLARSAYRTTQSALTDLLDRQPLVIGAIGLAIGAGVATAVASTAVENEWAGPISDEVKGLVRERTEGVADTAQRAAGELGDEFRAAASETADKLREAGARAARSFGTITG